MDGTGLVVVPNKATGHLRSAFNAPCPVMAGDKLVHCIPFHLLCATMATPFDYKRRPEAYWRRIRIFWTRHAPQLVQELKNTQIYTKIKTRVLRILAARTWVNDICADYQTRSLHNPAPANHRRDPSDSIGVVSIDIFGAPGRGTAQL